jgi:putative glutathione S-transferase
LHALEVEKALLAATKFALIKSRLCGARPVTSGRDLGAIVNNEPSDIIRMFNTAFDSIGAKAGDYYPEALRTEIDGLNARIYATVNNDVYRAGFATTQEAYEEAVGPLFETLDCGGCSRR